jgi:hypothetical protein
VEQLLVYSLPLCGLIPVRLILNHTPLEGVVRNTCHTPSAAQGTPTFEVTTTPNEKQKHALELIGWIKL